MTRLVRLDKLSSVPSGSRPNPTRRTSSAKDSISAGVRGANPGEPERMSLQPFGTRSLSRWDWQST